MVFIVWYIFYLGIYKERLLIFELCILVKNGLWENSMKYVKLWVL